MANVATLGAKATFDVADFQFGIAKVIKGLNSLRGETRSTGEAITEIGNKSQSSFGSAASAIAKYTGAMVAANAITGAMSSAWNAITGKIAFGAQLAMEAEKAKVGFEVMLKSSDKAAKMMKDIEAFALATPFNEQGLTNNIRLLKGMGIATEDLLPAMKTLGDLSLGDNEKLAGLALAFGQVNAKGKLMGQEFNQLAERGINLREDLARNLGIPVKDVAKAMEDGKISATLFRNSLIDLAERDFGGMMEKIAGTTGGTLDKIYEKINLIFKDLASGLLGADFTGGLNQLDDYLTKFRETELPGLIAAAQSFLSVVKEIAVEIGSWGESAAGFVDASQEFYNWGSSPIGEYKKSRTTTMEDFGAVGRSKQGIGALQSRLDAIRAAKAEGAAKGLTEEQMASQLDAIDGKIVGNKRVAPNAVAGDKALKGLEKIKPPTTFFKSIAGAFSDAIKGPALKGLDSAKGLVARGWGMAGQLGDMASSAIGSLREQAKPQEYRPTGALVAGSSEAYSAIIKNMAGGGPKTTIDEKQLKTLEEMAKSLAKMAKGGLEATFKGVGTVESFAAGGKK
ncbi:MAG: hypothetical protein EBR82_27920 [Caulobacteraceae bacterium]|nr:hypothetical protein [Caulobacteraceae bacterium]